jgi:SAM-dependent methyltransferase
MAFPASPPRNRVLEEMPWPALPSGEVPRWDGQAFQVAGARQAVLSYGQSESHWSPELTLLHEAEAGASHPIDVASRHLALRTLEHLGLGETPVVLDVGCSSGYLVEEIRRVWPGAAVIGSDFLLPPLLKLAGRIPGLPLLQFDLRNCPLPDSSITTVIALNVLEHIDDDGAALRQVHRILQPGGLAHLEVPAGPHLYDLYDEVLQHHRRYRLAEWVSQVRHAGFEVRWATHLGALLYPAFRWAKWKNQRLAALPLEEKLRRVAQQIRHTANSGLMRAALAAELALGRWIRYPFGIRCAVTLRKPETAPP